MLGVAVLLRGAGLDSEILERDGLLALTREFSGGVLGQGSQEGTTISPETLLQQSVHVAGSELTRVTPSCR